ncbi:UDP-glycosyltransferase UGT4-like [Adelges cooleyi]|uniref:UDP-glycosyltransferase UGT4-like n=1 Tax=Adelges cooleyi TaxID=133065 RepID=UPI00217FF34D|nr:UDP-glycosyltransferase UGT4-like [Adelges cooleyi]
MSFAVCQVCTMWSICLFFCALPLALNAANILVFWPMPSKSHFRGFEPLFTELSRRGHNVTVVSAFPKANPPANYTDIPVGDVTQGGKAPPSRHRLIERDIFQLAHSAPAFSRNHAMSFVRSEPFQDFIRSDSYAFDLVVIESFFQEYTVTLGHKFNAPVISVSPTLLMPAVSKWMGLPSTFSYVADIRVRSTDRMSFAERLKTTYIGFVQLYVDRLTYAPVQTDICNRYFRYKNWQSRPSVSSMLGNISVLLVNGHFSVAYPRPYLPNVVDVGGLHIDKPDVGRLPQSLKTFVESSEHGVIYFSLGTYLKPSEFPGDRLEVFVRVFGRLKQKILWYWPCDDKPPPDLPTNVVTDKWFPQCDILGHPNVKLFITHGGLHSVEESTYNAVPMVGIPFFADQFTNIKLVERKGYGKLVDFLTMTENSLHAAITDVLTDQTYKQNAALYSEIYKDGDMSPLDKAVYWVEYVLRHNGAHHLRSNSAKLNSIEYFLVDVIAVTCILVILLYLILSKSITLITNVRFYLRKVTLK